MTKLNQRNRVSLETKIKALDLLREGLCVSEVSKRLTFSNNIIRYWKSRESVLRQVYELLNDIERIKSTIRGPTDAYKYTQIKDKLMRIEDLYKRKQPTLVQKLRCLDLLPSFGNRVSELSKVTGYTVMSINLWRKKENLYRKLEKDKTKQSNMNPCNLKMSYLNKRVKNEDGTLSWFMRRKYPWICELETLVDIDKSKKLVESSIKNVKYEETKLDSYVNDEEIQKMLNNQHANYNLQTKIDALNMYDNGKTLREISIAINASVQIIKYWISTSLDLRKQALEIQRLKDLEYLRNNGESISNYDLESNIMLQKCKIRQSCKLTHFPTELKLKVAEYSINSNMSTSTVGEIFGCNRHIVRYFFKSKDSITQKLTDRDKLRSNRLLTLLTSCNHRYEVDKLNRMCKYHNPLEMLNRYLTFGTGFNRDTDDSMAPLRGRPPLLKPKVSPEIATIEEKRDRLAQSGNTVAMTHLYQELYCHEYRLLCVIDRRYTLLSAQDTQAWLPECNTDNKTRGLIAELQDAVRSSLSRLVMLHNLMLHQ